MKQRGFRLFPIVFFYYRDINDGYKMIGNAVPVELARIVAEKNSVRLKALYKVRIRCSFVWINRTVKKYLTVQTERTCSII